MKLKSVPAMLAVVVIVAGCGGSSTPTTSGSTTSSSASTPAGTTSTGSFASTNNCGQLVSLAGKYVQAALSAAHGGQFNLANALKADQALAAASPPAIHSDAEYVVHMLSGFVATLSKVGFKPGSIPSASQLLQLEAAARQFHAARFQAAVHHIHSWVAQNCHS